jgi:hypothetical protein
MLPLLFFACTQPEGDSAEAVAYEPAPYIVPEEDPPEAEFSAGDVEAAIGEAVALGLGLRGADVFPSYFAAMAGADENCPNYYEQDGNVYWYDVCTSSAGTQYNGYSFYYRYDATDVGYGQLYTGDAISGVAQVADAQGHLFEAGGTAYDVRIDGDGYVYWYSIAQGAFSYDGPEAEGTWLQSGMSPDMTQIAYWYPDAGAKGYVLQGSVSGLTSGFSSAVFDDVTVLDPTMASYAGGNCPEEPGGVVSLRDADGNWYDVVFDGYTDTNPLTPAAQCDGCGEAYFRGEALGSVCVDFTGLNGWEGAPW